MVRLRIQNPTFALSAPLIKQITKTKKIIKTDKIPMAFDIGRIKISYKPREIRYKKKLTKKTIIKYIAQKLVVPLHTPINHMISCFRIFHTF